MRHSISTEWKSSKGEEPKSRRCAEERHHSVPDEVLHRPAVALELRADALVIGPEQRLDVLGIHRLPPAT